MTEEKKSLNFIEQIIEEDLNNGLSQEKLRFRFPPEPNGYLHIGHAASICLNFGLGLKYNAPVNLRFDDTNPAKEEQEYVDAIRRDVKWLGFQWDQEFFSSDYFQQLYDWTIEIIKDGKAYIDNQSSEDMATQKGTPTTLGTNSPNRDRSVEENLALFQKMKDGELEEGSHVLRAKIDMQHVNMHMRDPIMYRILKREHHRTGNDWCIYPMYDWTHGESDYLEQISHSICTLEFKSHRDLYDWYVDQVVDTNKLRPKQREFARRNLSYTVMSKRKLLQLVEEGVVNGWDDPRMPTISGLRRRGYTANAIRKFSETAGISKRDNVTDVALLEYCIKDDLNKSAPRVMAVLDPLKLVITNYPEGKEEWVTAENNPEDENAGTREVPFSKEIYIEKEDFREQANKKFFRLKLGGEVRLKNTYIIKANDVVKDASGNITEVHCTYDEDSKSGSGTEASKRRVKGTLHWVSIQHAVKAEVRMYDRLFSDEAPDSHKDKDFKEFINPNSLTIGSAFVEPSLTSALAGDKFQFQRKGYFCADLDSNAEQLVFNKTVGLTDSWAKQEKKSSAPAKNDSFEKVGPIAGKFLKARSDEERDAFKAEIADLAKNIPFDALIASFSTAKSNKELLSCLLVLPHIETKEDENFASFIKTSLGSNNSTIKVEVVKYVISNTWLLTKFDALLQNLKTEDKNPFVRSLLEEAL
ncbi:glutamine--tRNA ligase/YqeY domain fusion protein [Flavicella sediminum]|uniref:glutamine--tRNA ligase/YqeY domain fusion protein n=1 Tax=Flavicella sediminum TaxID=2585141 RepID=UPI0011230CD7|nr:glutamine--tRNA ligase/YqeY domain fusion protein [Flavicella sediminum]